MPASARSSFDKYVVEPARTAVSAVKSGDYQASEVRGFWTNYVKGSVVP